MEILFIICVGILTVVALEMCLVCHCMIKIVAYLAQNQKNDDDDDDDIETFNPTPVGGQYQYN